MKKIYFTIAGILILMVGFVVGFSAAFYYFKANKEKFYSSQIKSKIFDKQIENINLLKPGQILYGKVSSKDKNQITLAVVLINPLDAKNSKEISVKIPVDQKDEIMRLKLSEDELLKSIKASFEEINVGDYLTVKILNDKKIIYLPTQK